MTNKFEIYYQKLATLGAGIKMGFPIHERISRIDRDASLVLWLRMFPETGWVISAY